MGCRLHWGEEYKIRWTGGWFNWNAEILHAIFRFLDIEIWLVNGEDDYGDFELSIDEFDKLQKILKDSRETDTYEEPIMTDEQLSEAGVSAVDLKFCMTWKQLDDWAKEVAKSYDKDNSYIYFSWF